VVFFALFWQTIRMKPLEPQIDFAVGGQAVIEGVMMRSPHFYTVSVRNPEGEIKMKQKKFESLTSHFALLRLPFLRGMVQLVESMIIGYRSLSFSNAVFIGQEEESEKGWKKVLFVIFGGLYALFTLGVTLFMLKFLPLWVAEQAAKAWPVVKEHYLLFNAIDGLTKITIFLVYIGSISLLRDIARVFQYHGAEHKSIWTYEKGLELTVANARKQTRFHPRCGTSFIFLVILTSVLVYTLVPPSENFWALLLSRIAVIPLIAGASYEVLKLSAKYQNFALVKMLVAPGLFLQRLTTREPDDLQLEVALNSLRESLAVEKLPVP
jgi:uncharacterized protein YqhQ